MLSTLINQLWNFLFPEACFGCNMPGKMLCDICAKKIPPPRKQAIGSFSLFDYKDPVIQKVIHSFKYKGGQRIGTVLGKAICERLIKDTSEGGALINLKDPVLIPIPLSKKRLRGRGFNQSEVLVDEISSQDIKKKFQKELSVLFRKEGVENQASIKNRAMRMENIKGCFEVRSIEKIRGKNILLIDDVTTTGATIEEARRVLLEAGAKRVIGVTVAH